MSRKAPWVRIPPSPPADTAIAVAFASKCIDSQLVGRYPQFECPSGSGAAEAFESRQVREEAAVRRLLWVPPGCRFGHLFFSPHERRLIFIGVAGWSVRFQGNRDSLEMQQVSVEYIDEGKQSTDDRNSIFVINYPDYSTGVDRNCLIFGKDQGVNVHF